MTAMVLQRIQRRPILDGLDLYRRLEAPDRAHAVNDPARIDAFIEELRQGLSGALSTPSTVSGWRAQALFASLVAALDGCVMLTQVDVGEIFVDGDSVKAPDFFLHLRDGNRILVDVKNIAQMPHTSDFAVPFGAGEIARLRRFGELYGAEVYLALYFSAASLWSLVSIEDLVPGPGGGLRIRFSDAVMCNKMVLLGDYAIGVTPPLELVLRPDQSTPARIDEVGQVSFTIEAAEARVGGQSVQSPEAQRIVQFLMMYGSWSESTIPVVEGSELVSFTWRMAPEEASSHGERFEIVGWLSSMYAQQFESGTTGPAGVTGLDLHIEPGSLVSLIPYDYKSDDLPLWRLHVSPADGEVG